MGTAIRESDASGSQSVNTSAFSVPIWWDFPQADLDPHSLLSNPASPTGSFGTKEFPSRL
jgi:hypothetical protein